MAFQMRTYYLIFALSFVAVFLTACSSGQIISAEKYIVKPGHRDSKTLINYEIVVDMKSKFSINKLVKSKEEGAIKFSILRLRDNLSLNSIKDLEPGKYKLKFVEDNIGPDQEFIYLHYVTNNKSKILKTEIVLGLAVHRK